MCHFGSGLRWPPEATPDILVAVSVFSMLDMRPQTFRVSERMPGHLPRWKAIVARDPHLSLAPGSRGIALCRGTKGNYDHRTAAIHP